MIDREELGAWLRVVETPEVGRDSARKLLAAFGSPQAVLDATVAARGDVVGAKLAGALSHSGPGALELDALIASTLAWLDDVSTEARDVLVLGDPRYPRLLLETADPPLLLYVQGRVDLLVAESIAVVGTRNPTPQGLENARAFSAHLSQAGLTIVSGLALGIDGAAHQGGLEGLGATIAVVGTGLDRVYPRRHLKLAHRIAQQGALLSEYAIGTPPMPYHFPNRNRIIAGLSRGTLVVEAAVQSGSLITARLASEAGRDVFAIPGSIHSPLAKGCHMLIKQGAKLVDAADDVLEELQWPGAAGANTSAAGATGLPGRADPLLEVLGFEPMALDTLIARTGRSAADLSAHLLDLELDGRVARLPGQMFQRLERA